MEKIILQNVSVRLRFPSAQAHTVRSGAYSINDDTFEALYQTGFLIDSSLYFQQKNNLLDSYSGLHNQVLTINGITEIPILTVFDGEKWRKLDIVSMPEKDILDTLEIIKNDEKFNTIQIMFHSFSFLDLEGKNETIPLINDGNKIIYGENIDNKTEFENILNYLKNSDDYNVTTFADFLKMDLPVPEYRDDNIIYLANKELAIFRTDIKAEIEDGKLHLFNGKDEDVSFAWVVTNSNDNDDKFYSGYDKQFREYSMSFPANANGIYIIKAYVMDSEKNKVSSGNLFSVTVENGVPVRISETW